MANRMAKAMVVGLLAGTGPAVSASAQTEPTPTVVVHTGPGEDQTMRPSDLAAVQALVVDVYAKAGVRIEWATSWAYTAPADGRRHLDLVIVNVTPSERRDPDARDLGRANRAAARALVYYDRIVRHAWRTKSDPTFTLALVMAHELGHVLLPEFSHSASGLMRADYGGPVRRMPEFSASQAETLRAMAWTTR